MGNIISLTYEKEGIAWITMEDMEGKNALTASFVSALQSALDDTGKDKSIKVVILAGLPEIFCSGADLSMLNDVAKGKVMPTELILARSLITLPIPVIAAAEGSAIGGGFALASAADMLVVARESRYGVNFISLGFTPGMGTTSLLSHFVSPAIAHELMYTGKLLKGKDFGCGINAVVPRSEVKKRALDIALRIAEHKRESITLLKRTLSLPRRKAFEESLTMESLMHEISFQYFDPSLMER